MTREQAAEASAAGRIADGENTSVSQIQGTKMNKIPRKSQAVKEQTIRIARMMTASTGITPEGFTKLCRTILRDSRSEDFQELYGEPPVLRRSSHTPSLDA